MQCGRRLRHTIVGLIQGLFVKQHPENLLYMYKSCQNLWQGRKYFWTVLGLESSTLLVAVNEGIFGLSHVECIGILTLFE